MKKNATVLFVIMSVLSCMSQNSKAEIKKVINEIESQLVTYENQPTYHANINSSACSFEFLINDMPVLSYYNKGGAATSVPINPKILSSGVQTFKIKLYPGYYKENRSLIQAKSLIKDTKFNVSFSLKDWNDLGQESQTVLEFSLPSTTNEIGIKEFSLAGNPYFEYKGTFKASVPYSLKGWISSVDLSEENQEDLEKEVIQTYADLISKFANKNIEDIVKYNETKAFEKLQSIYSTKRSDILEAVDNYSTKFDNSSFHLKELENYKMYIFGNGKTVCLLRTDLKNKGESVVRIGYTNKENKKRLSVLSYIFHRPFENSPLVPIR